MTQGWHGAALPEFDLESLDGDRWSEQRLQDRRAIVFCFASW